MSYLPSTAALRAPLALTALLVLAACNRDSLAPEPGAADASIQSRTAMKRDATTAAGRPALRPNAIKYRDSGVRPAKVKVGSDSLMARALLGRDGRTQVEATTGAFDTGVAPTGTITKVQVKYEIAGDAITSTFDDLSGGGYWSGMLAGLPHGLPVRVQATVRNPGSKNPNVLKVDTRVVRRPDLAVGALALPARVPVERQVNVTATITELNGDVGARFDCVLLVDGVPVGRAAGSWIDAGDAVGCAFRTEFATPGVKQVSVAATNVAPADWDDANNMVSTTIDVASSEIPLQWSMDFEGYDRADDYELIYDYGNGTVRRWGRKGTSSERSVWLDAITADTTSFQGAPDSVTFSATFVSGDSVIGVATANAVDRQWAGARCLVGRDDATSTSFDACRYAGDPLLYVWVWHSSARVTYYDYAYWGANVYHENTDTTEGFGAFPVGSSIGLDVRVVDGAGKVWRARGTTPVTSQSTESCSDPFWPGSTCTGYMRVTSYAGSASGS